MKFSLKILTTLAICILPLVSFCRNDAFWSTIKLSYDTNDFLFSVEELIAFEDEVSSNELFMQAGYQFCDYFSALIGHRIYNEQIYGKPMRLIEHRPTLELRFTVPEFCKLKFDFRTRFELRDKTSNQPYMRYRQRIRLRTAWNVTSFKISPYFHEELFFQDKPGGNDSDLYDRNRSQFGVSFLPVPKCSDLSCNAYFMLQHDLKDKWEVTNTYGIDFSYKF